MTAIITFARDRRTLAAVRSLGEKQIDIISGDSVYPAMTFFSKYSNKYFLYPSFRLDPEGFIASLEQQILKNKPDVLIPMDEETFLISRFRDRLEKNIRIPVHDYESLMKANNKEKLLQLAESLGIRIPHTYTPKGLHEIKNISEKVEYPVVIKLIRSLGSKGLAYANNKKELLIKYKKTIIDFNLSNDDYPLIQEYIPGIGYGVEMLFNNGDPRASFTHKRIREFPISGGPSTARVSVKNHSMEKDAEKLLKELNWHGVAMVEFKLDQRNNKPVLMEINPRFWGSLNQAIRSGVDFPYLLYQMAVEGDVKPVFNYKTGVKTRWFLGDARGMIDYILKSENRFEMLVDFLNFAGKDVYYDDISIEDPLPFIIEMIIPITQFIKTGKLTFIPKEERHLV